MIGSSTIRSSLKTKISTQDTLPVDRVVNAHVRRPFIEWERDPCKYRCVEIRYSYCLLAFRD